MTTPETSRKDKVKESLQKLTNFWSAIEKHLFDIGVFKPCQIKTKHENYFLSIRKITGTWQICYQENADADWKRIHDAPCLTKMMLCPYAVDLVNALERETEDFERNLLAEYKVWTTILQHLQIKCDL